MLSLPFSFTPPSDWFYVRILGDSKDDNAIDTRVALGASWILAYRVEERMRFPSLSNSFVDGANVDSTSHEMSAYDISRFYKHLDPKDKRRWI